MASATLVQDCPTGNTCPVPFTFKDHQIRTVVDGDDLWFVARDICAALSVSWCGTKTLATIPVEWQRVGNLPTRTRDGRSQVNKTVQISEPAVYKLAFRSNKPEADAFTNWVASEVLPAIRKTGQFAPAPIGPLTPAQCRHLHDVLDAKVGTLPKEAHRSAYAEAWTRFNRHFRIAKYAQLPQEQFSDALAYLIGMKIVAGSLGPAAQKALPAGNLVTLVDQDEVQRLVAQARALGGDMHNAVSELWNMIWQDVERWKHPDRPMALCQLRYATDEAFRVMDTNIEFIRSMVRCVDVTYREMRQMRG